MAIVVAVRQAMGLGLAEARTLVDAAPAVLAEIRRQAEAEAIRDRLQRVGAVVTLEGQW